MRIAIGSDHAGYHLKEHLREWLSARNIEIHDVGPHSFDPTDDYPDFARAVADSVRTAESDLGLIVCSTGVGSCIAANKIPGVRAALCHDTFSARMSRLHNDANVLCLGSNVVAPGLAEEILAAWLASSFSGEERHRRRVDKIAQIESRPEG
ncbi:MAG: ribose-5-phosphate isomerase [Candidatus Bathyarchaeota archaeon]|nr:ribose-5-phosphate isomerase [Candidatus Bathyarchaeota archaeon]